LNISKKHLPKTDNICYNKYNTREEVTAVTYSDICESLKNAGIENFRAEAELLISEMCGEFSPERQYDSESLSRAVDKRCHRYPLQYILGKWWLCRCEFFVDENCLVPRPDTETVIERAVKLLPQNATFADLCTGSGCIAVSILDLRPDTCADAVELYPKTLAIAEKNARHNNVEERFFGICADVLRPDILGEKKYDAIISNPPYIRTDVVDTLDCEVQSEPRAALDGGEDGLIFYRAILDNFEKNLAARGVFIFEIGYDQAADIRKIAHERGLVCEIEKDLGGCDRVAVISRK
jgi:release factor glutamine methyltransferase